MLQFMYPSVLLNGHTSPRLKKKKNQSWPYSKLKRYTAELSRISDHKCLPEREKKDLVTPSEVVIQSHGARERGTSGTTVWGSVDGVGLRWIRSIYLHLFSSSQSWSYSLLKMKTWFCLQKPGHIWSSMRECMPRLPRGQGCLLNSAKQCFSN